MCNNSRAFLAVVDDKSRLVFCLTDSNNGYTYEYKKSIILSQLAGGIFHPMGRIRFQIEQIRIERNVFFFFFAINLCV